MKCAQCGTEAAEGAQFCTRCGAALSAGRYGVTAASQVEVSAQGVLVYSGFWRRLGAYLLDAIILYIAWFVMAIVLAMVLSSAIGSIALVFFSIPFGWLYFALQESSATQATIGKRALGIKVVDERGERIGFGRATGRHFAKFLSSLTMGIGYVMIAFTQRKQALHDLVAGTLIVHRTVDAQAIERGETQQANAAGGVMNSGRRTADGV